MTQKDFERLSELMARKGVTHEAFELLADLRQSERLAKEEVLSIKNSVMDALKGFVGFEGFTPSEINYLQVIRKMKSQLTWRPASEKPEKGKEVILSYVDCYGHRINVLGSYVRRFDEETDPIDDEDVMEYDEKSDEYYLKEGWYEHTTHSDYDHWLLHEKIDKWLPIPPAPEGEKP